MTYNIETSADLRGWSPLTSVLITNMNGTAPITDPGPATNRQKFYRAVAN